MNGQPTKHYFRQRQQNRLYDAVVRAVEEAGVRRKEIANILDVPPSQITRLLSGPANWTSDTTSDLLFSVGAELDFNIVPLGDRAKGNRFHPVGEPAAAPVMVTGTATVSTASVSVVDSKGIQFISGSPARATQMPKTIVTVEIVND